MFKDCTSLTTLTIPSSVTTIGEEAFSGCTGLTTLTIPSSVTTVGNGTFSGCIGLTELNLEINKIAKNMFYGCTGLATLTIPSSVKTIEESALKNCTSLTSVILGENVKEIGNEAFSGDNALNTIICKRARPANTNGDGTFSTYETATLHVPKGSSAVYYSAPVWMKFDNIVEDGDVQPTNLKAMLTKTV